MAEKFGGPKRPEQMTIDLFAKRVERIGAKIAGPVLPEKSLRLIGTQLVDILKGVHREGRAIEGGVQGSKGRELELANLDHAFETINLMFAFLEKAEAHPAKDRLDDIRGSILHILGIAERGPVEYDRGFRDLCRITGMSPFVERFLPPDIVEDIVIQMNDEENVDSIRQYVMSEVFKLSAWPLPGEEKEWMTQYLLRVAALQVYPVEGGELFPVLDTDSKNKQPEFAEVMDLLREELKESKYPPLEMKM